MVLLVTLYQVVQFAIVDQSFTSSFDEFVDNRGRMQLAKYAENDEGFFPPALANDYKACEERVKSYSMRIKLLARDATRTGCF